MNQTHKITDPKNQALAEIERIEQLPRLQMWRAARDFYLKLHPELRAYEKELIQVCREIREEDSTNPTAASKSGSIRHTMKLPMYLPDLLAAWDVDFFAETSGKNHKGNQTKVLRKLYDTFPEYRIAVAF